MTNVRVVATCLVTITACVQPADDEASVATKLSSPIITSKIYNATSGKCLAVGPSQLEEQDCSASPSFSFELLGDGYYHVHPGANSGLCLGILGAQTVDRAPVVQWTCNTSLDQELALEPVAGGYTLVDHLSGRCVDLNGYGKTDGTLVQQFACTGVWNQTFTLPHAVANGSTGEAGTSLLGVGTSYFVDGLAGNDSHAGTSATSAWKTIAKVNASTFAPGDNILFAQGQTFSGALTPRSSGTRTAPITFGSYGVGLRPTIAGGTAAHGVDSNGASWIVIQDLKITSSTAEGVHVEGGGHVTARNLDLHGTCGGIQAWKTSDVWIENNVVHDGCAEGVWAYQVAGGFHVLGNRLYPMSGLTTDGMQLDYTPSYEVRCNYVDQGHQANDEKGDLTITRSNHGLVRDNVFVGGNYGIGMVGLAEGGPADNTVTNNHFIDNQDFQTWASGIKFDDNAAEVWVPAGSPAFVAGGPTHMTISDNLIEGDHNGIYIYDVNSTGDTLTITGNVANATTTPFAIEQQGIGSSISNNRANVASPLGATSCPGGGMPQP